MSSARSNRLQPSFAHFQLEYKSACTVSLDASASGKLSKPWTYCGVRLGPARKRKRWYSVLTPEVVRVSFGIHVASSSSEIALKYSLSFSLSMIRAACWAFVSLANCLRFSRNVITSPSTMPLASFSTSRFSIADSCDALALFQTDQLNLGKEMGIPSP
jgi:hypothetical protein